MSDTLRIIPITLDAETSSRRVVSGTTLALPDSTQSMELYYATNLLFRATILSGYGVPYVCPTDATWLFGMDDRFTADHADLVSITTNFNTPADWSALNVAGGKICWRCDLEIPALLAALDLLGTAQSMPMWAYLWMLPTDGNYTLIATWPITMWRVAVDPND